MNARGHVDEVRFIDPLARNLGLAGTGHIPEDSSVYVRGWGFLTEPPRAADAAVGTIDDGEPFELAYNQARQDVVRALGLPALLPIGFHAVRSLANLPRGRHELRIALVERATGERAPIDATVPFTIVDGRQAFPATERLPPGEMTVAVDAFTAATPPNVHDATNASIARGAVLTLRGWAVDRRYTTAASDVYACVDGAAFTRGIIGTLRADVAGSLGLGAVARCGFVVRVATAALASGNHVMTVRAIAADGERYAVSDSLPFALI